MTLRITTTAFRPRLSELLVLVERNGERVVLERHGRAVAAVVGMDDLRRLWDFDDEAEYGPIDPSTGRPFGAIWVRHLWHGRYERTKDPDAHLHPSRAEAPWLGRPFEWPPKRLQADAQVEPRAEQVAETQVEVVAEPKPDDPRPWWRRMFRWSREHDP
jgi:antitoxin (DNA-binding transcriptional repressor) of toxin-antitoxin stability system